MWLKIKKLFKEQFSITGLNIIKEKNKSYQID